MEPLLGVSSGSSGKILLLSLLISFTLITVAGHIHFRPIGMSLFVYAWFIFTDSFSAFFLVVVLDLAIKALLLILIGVVSKSLSDWNHLLHF
jgi:hypothetical protein